MLRVEPIIHTAFNKSPIGAYIRPHIFCRLFFRRRMESPGRIHSTLPMYSTVPCSRVHIQSCTTCPHTDFLLLPINSGKFQSPIIPLVLISQTAQAGTQQLQTSLQPWELSDPCFRDKLGNPPRYIVANSIQFIDVVPELFFPFASAFSGGQRIK